jgi:hypothetical protein
MNKPFTVVALLISTLLMASTFAKTITDEKSGVLIDLPEGDGWKIEVAKLTTTAVNDEGVSLVIMRFERQLPDVVIKRLADSFDLLMKDAKAGDDVEKITVHGMQADKLSGHGSKDDKAVKFTAVLICKDNTSTVAVIAVGAETPFKRHLRDIDTTLDSIRPK